MERKYKLSLYLSLFISVSLMVVGIVFAVVAIIESSGITIYNWISFSAIFLAFLAGFIPLHVTLRRTYKQKEEIRKQYDGIYQLNLVLKEKNLEIENNKYQAFYQSRQSESIFNNIDDIIVSYTADYKILKINDKFKSFYSIDDNLFVGMSLLELFASSKDKNEIISVTIQVINSKEDIREEISVDFPKKGEVFLDCIFTPVFDKEGELESIILIGRDVTENKKHEEHVHRLVYYDYLTDLANRDMLLENLNDYIKEALYTKNKSAVICIGLDDFKKLNDTFGHTRGDLILKAVSTRLNNLVGRRHKLYRIGGDEFAVLIKNSGKDDQMLRLLSQINLVFNQAIIVESNSLYVSASMGVAIHGLHGFDAHTLITNADTAMNSIKRKGTDRHAYFNENMKVDIYKNVQIENALRTSIINNELYLNYQPQVSALTGRIRGFEALLRWQNPELGYIPPNEFIPILESTHQIIEVGFWVLKEACDFQVKLLKLTGEDVVISVNISAVQLLQKDFVDVVKGIIQMTGIKPNMLELEITESHVMDALNLVNQRLEALREIGITIALDDFGTGYSSLNYLRNLNCDILKIDKTFIDDLINDQANVDVIVGAIIVLSKELGFSIVAEGVEYLQQVHFLTEKKCDYFQGYYFSKPLSEELAVLAINGTQFSDKIVKLDNKIG